jgi:hypothetical protein
MGPGAVTGAINDRVILDFPHDDLRRRGPGAHNIIPATARGRRGRSNGLTKC